MHCVRGLWQVVLAIGMSLLGVERCRSQEADESLRVMTFNIRYGTANDGVNHWDKRKEFLVETIARFDPDLLGTQETLRFQKDYLDDNFPSLQSIGVGRDDGKDQGEMAALYFRRERFELLDQGDFWLSPTPEQVGSKGWDAALPRIATWVKLRDKRREGSLPILYLNTHFDHKGEQARVESARLIRQQLARLGQGCLVIVTGDFNAGSDSDVYSTLFSQNANLANSPSAESRDPVSAESGELPSAESGDVGTASDFSLLVDTFVASQESISDPDQGTFSGFVGKNRTGPRIDWIGCSKHFVVRSCGIDRTEKEGRTPSDHFPVTAVLVPEK